MLLADATTDFFTSIFSVVLILILFAIILVPYWVIVKKAGYSGWLSLLMLIPLVNIIMVWVFAFSEWPNLKNRSSSIVVPE